MTKEEAIGFMQNRIELIDKYYPDIKDYREALVMAIKSLKQEPKTDILDNIREKMQEGLYGPEEISETDPERAEAFNNGLNYCIDIVDKYREGEVGK